MWGMKERKKSRVASRSLFQVTGKMGVPFTKMRRVGSLKASELKHHDALAMLTCRLFLSFQMKVFYSVGNRVLLTEEGARTREISLGVIDV